MERRNYELYHLIYRDRHGSVHHAETLAVDRPEAKKKFEALLKALKVDLRLMEEEILTNADYRKIYCLQDDQQFLEPKGFYFYYWSDAGREKFVRIFALTQEQAEEDFAQFYPGRKATKILTQREFLQEKHRRHYASPAPADCPQRLAAANA